MQQIIGSILGLFFIAIGVVVAILGYGELRKAKGSLEWPATEGIVIASEVRTKQGTDADEEYSAYVLFEYTVQGVAYSSTKIGFGLFASSSPEPWQQIVARYPRGKTVAVYFDPEKPSMAVLERGGDLQVICGLTSRVSICSRRISDHCSRLHYSSANAADANRSSANHRRSTWPFVSRKGRQSRESSLSPIPAVPARVLLGLQQCV